MQIDIRAPTARSGLPWLVQLDRQLVPFRSEAEARAFVSVLRARLDAPHRLTLPTAGAAPSSAPH